MIVGCWVLGVLRVYVAINYDALSVGLFYTFLWFWLYIRRRINQTQNHVITKTYIFFLCAHVSSNGATRQCPLIFTLARANQAQAASAHSAHSAHARTHAHIYSAITVHDTNKRHYRGAFWFAHPWAPFKIYFYMCEYYGLSVKNVVKICTKENCFMSWYVTVATGQPTPTTTRLIAWCQKFAVCCLTRNLRTTH